MQTKNPIYKFYILAILFLIYPLNYVADLTESVLSMVHFGWVEQLVQWGLIQPLTVPVLLFLILKTHEKLLWRLRPFCWLHRIPYIGGRYKCEIISSFSDPSGNNKYDGFLEVTQNFSNILVNLYTQQSCSYSVVANFGKDEFDVWSIFYIYHNKPSTVRSNLSMRTHSGSAKLKFFKDVNGKRLEGDYYNDSRDRKTHGQLICKFHSKEINRHF